MHILEVVKKAKEFESAKQKILNDCEDKIEFGMSEKQVLGVLTDLGVIGNFEISREDVEESFLSDISSNVFNYNEPLSEFHYLMKLIEDHVNWIIGFNVE